MKPNPHFPIWQDFTDTVELTDSELVGARFRFTYTCRGALKKHVASFDGTALLTGCQWGNRDHSVIVVPVDIRRMTMRPGCQDPIHVTREFWIADSSFPDGSRNRVVEEDLFPPEDNATYSTVVINALRGLSAYDLYIQQGGTLPLQEWLELGGYSQETMAAVGQLVENMRQALLTEITDFIQNNSGKQDVIPDLDTIRAGAALGATAIQSHQDISGKQDVIPDLDTIRASAALGATALQSESDPTVPSWAKQPEKPAYSASEVFDTDGKSVSEKFQSIASLVDSLTAIGSTNFGGYSIDGVEEDAVSGIVSKYSADGHLAPDKYWYLAGSSLASLKVYEYAGSGAPALVSSTSYDFTDIFGLRSQVNDLAHQFESLFLEVEEDGLFFIDGNNYIGAWIDNDGFHAFNMLNFNLLSNG